MPQRIFVLEVLRIQDKLKVGFFDETSTVRSYEEIPFPLQETGEACDRIASLLNKAGQLGALSSGTCADLRRSGHILFDQLLPVSIKRRLQSSPVEYLVFEIDETLVSIPWELLFDGQQFLCLRFDAGRRVKTARATVSPEKSVKRFPLRMLILADPQGNLPAAAQEAQAIRGEMDALKGKILATSRVKNIPPDYVKQRIHDYDILHYAGHAEMDGWVLAGGKITAADILAMGTRPLPGLVFMNSCHSADENGKRVDNDGERQLFSLANAFLISGGRHVVGTLWKIADDAALIAAKEFYRQFVSGHAVGRAMREARKRLISEHGEDHIVWAGYVLYGDPSWSWQTPSAVAAGGLFSKRNLSVTGAALGFLLLLGAIVPVLQFETGRRAYIREDYHQSARLLANAAAWPILRVFPETLSLSYQGAGSASAMAHDYDAVVGFYKKALDLAKARRKKTEAARLSLTLADAVFEKNIFIDLFDPRRNGEKHSPQEMTDLYQNAIVLAGEIADVLLQARALEGMARVEESKGEWKKAVSEYLKAVELLGENPRDASARLSVLRMNLALAHAYANHHLDFSRAYAHLQKLPDLVPRGEERNDAGAELKLFYRRFEFFLRTLAEKGYKNSDFYRKAGAIYDQMQ